MYNGDTGRFPIRARSVNQYIMIVYHCDANLILAVPFNTSKYIQCLISYNKIMQILRDHKLNVELKIIKMRLAQSTRGSLRKNGTLIIN